MFGSQELIEWLIKAGIKGGILPSAKKVAKHYLEKCNHDKEEAIKTLIGWKTAHAATTGFTTGVGGFAALPAQIPSSIGASYLISTNTIASIAEIKGYNSDKEEVRTLILMCLVANSAEIFLKDFGIRVGKKFSEKALYQISGKVLIEINKKVGFRLITKAGEKGAVNLIKFIPLAGGVVGATIDSNFVKASGEIAKKKL